MTRSSHTYQQPPITIHTSSQHSKLSARSVQMLNRCFDAHRIALSWWFLIRKETSIYQNIAICFDLCTSDVESSLMSISWFMNLLVHIVSPWVHGFSPGYISSPHEFMTSHRDTYMHLSKLFNLFWQKKIEQFNHHQSQYQSDTTTQISSLKFTAPLEVGRKKILGKKKTSKLCLSNVLYHPPPKRVLLPPLTSLPRVSHSGIVVWYHTCGELQVPKHGILSVVWSECPPNVPPILL